MGTFRIKLGALSVKTPSGTFPADDDSWATDDIIVGMNVPTFSEALNLKDTDAGFTSGKYAFPTANISLSVNFRLRFDSDPNGIVLDGDEGSPIGLAGLPAGFTPTSAQISCRAWFGDEATYGAYTMNFKLQTSALDTSADLGAIKDTAFHDYAYAYSSVPSMLSIFNNGCGLISDILETDPYYSVALLYDYLSIEGTYTIASSTWYYNPITDHYQYSSSDPGAPWTTVPSMPAPTVTAVHPSSGSIQGGTPVTIIGTYFGD